MKHLSTFLVLALSSLACSTGGDTPQAGSRSQAASGTATTITLLAVGDTHSHLDAWGPKDEDLNGTLGGLPKAAALIGYVRALDPAHTIFVHAGDFMNGDLFFNEYLGVPELQLLQSLQLDVLALGNHELQFGPEFLAGVLDFTWPGGIGAVPIVGTNLDLSGFSDLGAWINSTVVKDVGGVKVGFLGVTTPYDPLELPAPVVIVGGPGLEDFTQLESKVANATADLRADGAQVIVCIAHIGMDLSRLLAADVPGIDVIVNGHDHVALAQPETVGTTTIISAGDYYRWVARLTLSVDGGAVSVGDYALMSVDGSTPAVSDVQTVVDVLKGGIVARYGDVYHTPLAWADAPIPNDFDADHAKRDTAIGDLFTDGYRAATGTDIAFEASGFLDEGLPQGAIVGADLYRAMSYGLPAEVDGSLISRPFRLATFRLSGLMLLTALETALAGPPDVFPQVSGMRLQIDSSRPPGEQIVPGSVHIGGHLLELDRIYTVTANEYVPQFLQANGIRFEEDSTTLDEGAVDAVRALVLDRGVLEPATSGRIRDVAAVPGKGR